MCPAATHMTWTRLIRREERVDRPSFDLVAKLDPSQHLAITVDQLPLLSFITLHYMVEILTAVQDLFLYLY